MSLPAPDTRSVSALPWVISAAHPAESIDDLLRHEGPELARLLDVYGGLLFRGFDVRTERDFERMVAATSAGAMPYVERSSPRTHIAANIYTSTDYPPRESIFLHNEQSYNDNFPLKIYFCCLQAALSGGQTPIADCRKIFERISPATRRLFADGYLLVRNFGIGPGMGWREAFQTSAREQVEAYCLEHDIRWEWGKGEHLRTVQRRRAYAQHPRTGETVWFNHCTFFHPSTLPEAYREALSVMKSGELPNETFVADGSAIDPSVLDELRAAYVAEMKLFDWARGDILMLDNMLVAHGRRPFSGPRRVVVAMADLCHCNALR